MDLGARRAITTTALGVLGDHGMYSRGSHGTCADTSRRPVDVFNHTVALVPRLVHLGYGADPTLSTDHSDARCIDYLWVAGRMRVSGCTPTLRGVAFRIWIGEFRTRLVGARLFGIVTRSRNTCAVLAYVSCDCVGRQLCFQRTADQVGPMATFSGGDARGAD